MSRFFFLFLLAITLWSGVSVAQDFPVNISVREESVDEYGVKTPAKLTFWPGDIRLGNFFLLETGGNRVDLRGWNENSEYLTHPYDDTYVWIECLMENGKTKSFGSGSFINILVGAGVLGRDKELKAVRRNINTLLSAKKSRVTVRLINHPDWNTTFEMELTEEQRDLVREWMGYDK